jgi:hypothetical protein
MFTIAATLALLSGPAIAQMTPQTNPTTQPPPPMPTPPQSNSSTETTRSAPPKPASFQGTDEEWGRHVQRCQRQHSDYDPATDQYRDAHGAMKTCPR